MEHELVGENHNESKKEGKRKAEEAGIGNGEEEDPEVTKRIAMKEKFQKDKIAASGLD